MAEISAAGLFGRLVPSLVLILGALLVIRWWAQRNKGLGRHTAINVISRASLSKSASVAVIEVQGQRFLVGTTDQHIQMLAELGDDTDMAEVTDRLMHDSVESSATGTEGAGRRTAFGGMASITDLTSLRAAADAARTGSWMQDMETDDRPRTGVIGRLQRLTVRKPTSTSVRRADRGRG